MTHAWCHDIARDEAVRAAEDKRNGRLPTLGETIARPFADAAERSSTVSKTGEGQSGLRTERVTLEVTGAPGWRVHVNGIDVESVRVVDEPHFDDLAQVAMERDAAIREREEARQVAQTFESLCLGEQARNKVLQARVSELEAASGGGVIRDMTDILRSNTADADEKHAALSTLVEAVCPGWVMTQAASGGGEGEPVAWGVRMKSGTFKGFLFPSREQANKCAELITDEVVAFFEAPPQPRGWLTGEEREALDAARDYFDDDDHGDSECVFIARVLKQLIARSSPPEVVLPALFSRSNLGDRLLAEQQVRQALAAAGVAVKEVGK